MVGFLVAFNQTQLQSNWGDHQQYIYICIYIYLVCNSWGDYKPSIDGQIGECLRFQDRLIKKNACSREQAELYPEVCYCYVHLALQRQSRGHGWHDTCQFYYVYSRCKFLTDSCRILFTSYHECSIYIYIYIRCIYIYTYVIYIYIIYTYRITIYDNNI